ncbi:transporter substrate-binding domain-containing protein [Streptomyces sp. CC224E]|uniref:transporter substrate-binding domain-containing protein n=1 Tax=unclassified Streptomyces TaxID=2593676 RepID=UPI003557CE3F
MTPTAHLVRRRVPLAAAVCLVALTTSCGNGAEAITTKDGVHLVHRGSLTTCTHLPYAPFQSERDGKVVGFDVSLMDLVAKRLGVKQDIVDKSFETIKTGADLNAGLCDVAAAGMTITDERKQNLDFADPYFDAAQGLLARKGVEARTLADVKRHGLTLGSQAATTGESLAHDKGIDSVSFESSDAELNGLRTGQVDLLIQDYPVAQNWLKTDASDAAKFDLVATIPTGEQYGFAVKKDGNPKLLDAINKTLSQAKRDGTYKKLYEKWIGPMPKDVTSK